MSTSLLALLDHASLARMMHYVLVNQEQADWVKPRPWLCSLEPDRVEWAIELLSSTIGRDLSEYIVMGARPGDQFAQRLCRADRWIGPSRTGRFVVTWPDPEGELADEAAHREHSDNLNREKYL